MERLEVKKDLMEEAGLSFCFDELQTFIKTLDLSKVDKQFAEGYDCHCAVMATKMLSLLVKEQVSYCLSYKVVEKAISVGLMKPYKTRTDDGMVAAKTPDEVDEELTVRKFFGEIFSIPFYKI